MATTPAMKIVKPYTPELLDSAQKFISEWIWGRKYDPVRVLEFGAGWSTIWFASLGTVIYSVEHDRGWYNEVMGVMLDLQFETDYRIYLENENRLGTFLQREYIENEFFDVVYVDCVDEYRVDVARASLDKLKYGGILILDDTHWQLWTPLLMELSKSKHYRHVDVFNGWHVRKDGQAHLHETSIFEKVK